jgi:hypothetical protein
MQKPWHREGPKGPDGAGSSPSSQWGEGGWVLGATGSQWLQTPTSPGSGFVCANGSLEIWDTFCVLTSFHSLKKYTVFLEHF